MTPPRKALLGLAASLLALTPLTVLPSSAEAATTTCSDAQLGGTLCLTVPDLPLTGVQTVSATWSGLGTYTLEFTLNSNYLNFEYKKPYTFSWPTDKELDGTYSIAVRVHKGSNYSNYVSQSVALANGNGTSIPRSSTNYDTLFQPQAGSVIAAVGNGGAQKSDELKLESYIESTKPAAFFYLGEVHEFGTWATRLDHYGLASIDDPNGVGTEWGRMAGYTLPTAGNHERTYITQYQDYWHQRPLWSTTVIDGVRVYDLTSECNINGGCGANGQQANWLSTQLATNSEQCVLSMWHRPVVANDTKRSGTTMDTSWSMLANNGGDLVLNADTREMEEINPMNAAKQTGQPGSHMVELVSGAAAARWVISNTSDTRVAWHVYKTPGAVFVTHNGNTLDWEFRDFNGNVLRNGYVDC